MSAQATTLSPFIAILSGGSQVNTQDTNAKTGQTSLDKSFEKFLLSLSAEQNNTSDMTAILSQLVELDSENDYSAFLSLFNALPTAEQEALLGDILDNYKALLTARLETLQQNSEIDLQQEQIDIIETAILNMNNSDGDDISLKDILETISTLNNIALQQANESDEDTALSLISLSNLIFGSSDDEDNSTVASIYASLWQCIPQESNSDNKNLLVLNLSNMGLSDEIIAELETYFSDEDLITILSDPTLTAQLKTALDDINTSDNQLSADAVISTFNDILEDVAASGSNISISINAFQAIDQVISNILRNSVTQSNQSASMDSVDVTLTQTSSPILQYKNALMQISTNGLDTQNATVSSQGEAANPFALSAQTNEDGTVDIIPQQMLVQQNATANGSNTTTAATASPNAAALGNIASQNANQTMAMGDFDLDSMLNIDSSDIAVDGDSASWNNVFQASFKTAFHASNNILVSTNAAQANPATQTVATTLSKMTTKVANGETVDSYRMRLDPPELGRVDIDLDFIRDTSQIKAVISVEKPETLAMLQKDMHTLLKSMQDAGFDAISQQDISFTLSDSQGDSSNNNGNGSSNAYNNSNQSALNGDDIALEDINGEMSVIIDPVTGQRSINMLV